MPNIQEEKRRVEKLGLEHGLAGKKHSNPHPNPLSVYHFHYEERYAEGKAQHDKQKEMEGGGDSKQTMGVS
jgi:hypothetical protein